MFAVHPFRFGVTASWVDAAAAWTSLAHRAEELGYDVLLMPDHLGHQLAPVAALTAAAMATTRLHVGAFVFANDYRHPLLLAREAATLNFLSGGRFELGLGAGWATQDYARLGMPYDRPRIRVDRLEESVSLVKRLLAGETVDHVGEHYHLSAARVAAHPDGGNLAVPPRLMIGGGGPRMLRLAAREANIVGLLPQFDRQGRPMIRQATGAATARKVALLREAAGARFEELELNVLVADAGLVDGRRPAAAASSLPRAVAAGLIGTPYLLHGTLRRLETLLRRRRDELGISYYVFPARSMETMAPLVEKLAGR